MRQPKTHINQTNEDQTQILKATREKQQITHKRIPIRITAHLSTETLQARKEWQDILKVMKEKNLQPRLLYPAKVSFKYESESEVAQSCLILLFLLAVGHFKLRPQIATSFLLIVVSRSILFSKLLFCKESFCVCVPFTVASKESGQ